MAKKPKKILPKFIQSRSGYIIRTSESGKSERLTIRDCQRLKVPRAVIWDRRLFSKVYADEIKDINTKHQERKRLLWRFTWAGIKSLIGHIIRKLRTAFTRALSKKTHKG